MYSLMDVRAMLRPPGSGWLQFLPRLCLLGSGESASSDRSLVPQSVKYMLIEKQRKEVVAGPAQIFQSICTYVRGASLPAVV